MSKPSRAKRSRRAATVRYERDVMGTVIRKDAAGAVISYTYDPAGRLLQAVGPDGEFAYQYD